ncbi:pre-rRNA processing protein, Nop58p [Trichosporon asahii var. asahii CBS 2479]|uniref:Nucleolar protein 58 n=1 Tax=Trichosporon asahii var. asahii (strain ATCC 90039 / CBS 2479 / JCM 2466 / KCTC 7840 / NBRC 103889/ NCYC 2677 / UAMH 7654) TaxID=1186058 RepID=J5TCC8_TRIAS|nr:pre-rRNA processing protein, Nop58p [Trichosporon asahii var. asahii CBS 2479]EJT50246.1 pre-rRNA processing protein, Nop58p [Trichosporon asahii var. asahii CBS 2479]
MLVLSETPIGFVVFKLGNDYKLDSKDLWKEFETPEKANKALKVEAIQRFTSTATAVEDLAAIQDGRLTEGLEKFLVDATGGEGKKKKKDVTLVVSEPKLAATITKSLKIPVVSDSSTQDLYRGIRQQLASLLGGVEQKDLNTMSLGLGHSLSRFKLKFSTDKVDTMVIQAIALLDDLDKEINIYSMRVKEWYGWHFPEMGKIIVDNLAYARVVKAMGFRTNAASTDFSMVLPEDLEATLKQAAELSMGTEISDTDMNHINDLCDQVISITEYRTQLSEYLRNRMQAIAPNLTALVGDLVGARLISHAGSLMNLAKFPASTVQILGAEKALFRALKTKHDTPKYGLIYHASLVGQAPQKLKGKMARMTSTKASLSIRLDALSDAETKSEFGAGELGIAERIKLESRLRALEHRAGIVSNRTATSGAARQQPKFELTGSSSGYNANEDNLLPTQPAEKEDKKDKKKKRESLAAAADGDVSMADGDVSIAPEGETKEERRARKEAKKAAKAAKKLAEAAGAAVAAAGEVQEDVDEKKRKKEEKKKRRASEANGAEDGEKKKKKKRHSEV